jgi:hypothetical protein
VPGNHESILREPGARAIAEILEAELLAAEAANAAPSATGYQGDPSITGSRQ